MIKEENKPTPKPTRFTIPTATSWRPPYRVNEEANRLYEKAIDFLKSANYQNALDSFEDAACAGHPCALARLHWLYSGASGIMPADYQRLKKYQTISEDKIKALKDKAQDRGRNDKEAQFNLGWCYQQGLGVERDFAKAAEYYWQASEQGHLDARYHLGVCCSAGMGVDKDMGRAISFYEQVAAQGHVHANYVLCQCYEWGLGVEPDAGKAANFKQAAQRGKHPLIVYNQTDKETIARLEQTVREKEAQLDQKELQLSQQRDALEQADHEIIKLTKELSVQAPPIINTKHQQPQIQEQQLKEELRRQATYLAELEQTVREKDVQLNQKELQLRQQIEQNRQQQQKESRSSSGLFQPIHSTKPPSVLDEENLNLLLKGVVEGHLEKVEKLLSSNPKLASMKGDIKDLSDREFKGITALQYAYWALDVEMMEVIIKYTDNKVELLSQLNSFESNPARYTHGLHYDDRVLAQKITEYIKNCSKWSEEQCANYWRKEIGSTQRMCPAWLIYAMCEEGRDVAWTTKNEDRKVKREYDKEHLKWWFEREYDGGKLGEKWAAIRGKHEKNCVYRDSFFSVKPPKPPFFRLPYDAEFHGNLRNNRIKAVENIKTQLTPQNYSNKWN